MFLGLMAYLARKLKGTRACQGTGGRAEASGRGAGGPRDMAKAGLPEAQSPAVNVRTRRKDAWNRCRVLPCMNRETGHPPDAEPCPVRALKEMSGRPMSR